MKKWKEEFELFIAASGIADKKQALALLLHLGGAQLREIYGTLKEDGDTFEAVKEKFTTYFQPRKNTTYKRFKFKDAKQEKNESNHVYITRLKTLAESCDFPNGDDEIRDHFIYTCRSKTLKTKLLREEALTLEKLTDMAQKVELSQIQANEIDQNKSNEHIEPFKSEEKVNNVKKKYFGGKQFKNPSKNQQNTDKRRGETKPSNSSCYRCGVVFTKDHKQSCPAMGRKCYQCGRLNHLSKVCRAKKPTIDRQTVRQIENDPTTESETHDEIAFAVQEEKEIVNSVQQQTHTHVQINDTPINMLIDTGSTINIIDTNSFNKIQKNNNISLKQSKTKIFPYGSEKPLEIKGYFQAVIESKHRIITKKVFVVNKPAEGNLIGYQTAKELHLIQIDNETVNRVNKHSSNEQHKGFFNVPKNLTELCENFVNVTNGRGKFLNYKCKLSVEESVKPVQQQLGRRPYTSSVQPSKTNLKQ